MKKMTTLAALVAMMFAGSALAGPPSKCGIKAKSGCSKSAQTVAGKADCSKACLKAGCPKVAKVIGSLPQMTYKAGDLETPCFKTATDKAGCASKVQCIVDGKTYDCKREASAALASLLEKELDSMMTVQYSVDGKCVGCPNAAKAMASSKSTPVKYRLAGVDFDTQEKADAASKAVHEAVARLAESKGMKYCRQSGKLIAGDKKWDCAKSCSKSATTASGKSGCCPKSGATVASAKSGCGSKASTVAGAKSGCGSKASTVAGAKSGCGSKPSAVAGAKSGCGSKASAVAGAKSGCGSKASTVAAKSGCCGKDGACPNEGAEGRVAQLQDVLRVMVETATQAQTS